MLILVDYMQVIKKVRGQWRYVQKPRYKQAGIGAGLENINQIKKQIKKQI